jgi:nucleoside-diphosphate-sugar epimerase
MRCVFVTGGTGFVGRSVIQALRSDGYTVRCLVRRGSERDLRGLESRATSWSGEGWKRA